MNEETTAAAIADLTSAYVELAKTLGRNQLIDVAQLSRALRDQAKSVGTAPSRDHLKAIAQKLIPT